MNPMKVYPKEGEKARLLNAFTDEKSILGAIILLIISKFIRG